MNKALEDSLNIRYVKLHFTIAFNEEAFLPRYKTSALRGGMGEMLLRANCIRNRDCDKCDFYSECIVQRTMYSQFDEKPAFVTTGDSIGYVVECEDYRKHYDAGEEMTFALILFGKTIVYFSQYMQALHALGANGLGKDLAKFRIMKVTNSKGIPILDGYNIYMEHYVVENLKSYVDWRMSNISNKGDVEINIPFITTLKYEGKILKSFNIEAIVRALKRRIYILDSFEGFDGKEAYDNQYDVPNMLSEESREDFLERYSTRKDKKIRLPGIYGKIKVKDVSEDVLALLLTGEIIHVGKNTSLGFGRVRVKEVER